MNPILLDIPHEIKTERLTIRAPRPGDGPELCRAMNETFDELKPWMPWAQSRPTEEESELNVRQAHIAFLERKELRMHLYLKDTDVLVGSSGYHNIEWEIPKFEIGYWCRTRFTGQGYITEAVRALTALAFDIMGAQRVQICMDTTNKPSVRVAERVGYVFESEQPNERTSGDGEVRNTYVYRLIPAEYEELIRVGRLLPFEKVGDNSTVKPVQYGR